ncbi:MAG: hypothetical protein ACRDZM_14670 [Acidimicrobiia bacterium]
MDMGSELRVIEVEKEVLVASQNPSPETRQDEVQVENVEITGANRVPSGRGPDLSPR